MEHILTEKEQECLKNIDERLYYTTHNPKNKDSLPIYIFWSVVCLIFKGAVLWELAIWGFYCYSCHCNNEVWKNKPENITDREMLLDFRKKLINGDVNFPIKSY